MLFLPHKFRGFRFQSQWNSSSNSEFHTQWNNSLREEFHIQWND
jgi:hypothetical protein